MNVCLKLSELKTYEMRVRASKPLVDPPELDELVRDSDRKPLIIPGAFPTIFQNETRDPYNYLHMAPEFKLWGPHVLASKGYEGMACAGAS